MAHSGDDADELLDVYEEGLGWDFRQTPWKKPSPREIIIFFDALATPIDVRLGCRGVGDRTHAPLYRSAAHSTVGASNFTWEIALRDVFHGSNAGSNL